MKSTLGKILFTLLLLSASSYAQSSLASYALKTNKTVTFVKEPIVITFVAHQKDHTDHMFFSLTPHKSKEYTITLLQKKINDSKYHDSSVTFTYLLFPLQAKNLHINFDFIIKTASDQAIKQSYVDDHDNSVAISTYDTKIMLKPLNIEVKSLAHQVDLVGDFRLTSTIDKTTISEFEDINVHYLLVGKGYDVNNSSLFQKTSQNISLFTNIHDAMKKITQEGYIIKKEYTYAFTAKDNFTIPAVKLKAYSPSKKIYYTLQEPARNIKVTKVDISTLVDTEEFPQEKSIDFTLYKNIFIASIIFFAGFLTAKVSSNFSFKKRRKKFEDIQNAESVQALTLLLLHKYSTQDIKEFIDTLEQMEYKKTSTSLKEIKAEIIKKFK